MISKLDTVIYTVTFLLPGFIIFYIKSSLVQVRCVESYNHVFRYLFYSAINMIISIPLIYFINVKKLYNGLPFLTIVIWLGIVIIIPIIIGFIGAIISINKLDRKFINLFCKSTIIPEPTAWDYKFGSISDERFIIVKLTDNSLVRGKYSTKSCSGSSGKERDLYLEEFYTIDSEGEWEEIPNSDGILIKESQIAMIDFRKIDC